MNKTRIRPITAEENESLNANDAMLSRSDIAYVRRMIELYPSGIVSIVADTYDFWNVIVNVTEELKPEILARDGKVVFRPDSGDPVRILCGYNDDEIDFDSKTDQWRITGTDEVITNAERLGAVACLWHVFGGTFNDHGFRVLDSHVGLIYGDSITLPRAKEILERLMYKGFASNNVVFGIGSFTYQHITRDSFGWAMKATSGVVNGERRTIQKSPKTDNGVKKSAAGLLVVEREGNDYVLYDHQTEEQERSVGAMRVVFRDGLPYNMTTLEDIRIRLTKEAKK